MRHSLAFPAARSALAKSAPGDDLISGSDFLSVFIGASKPRRPSTKADKQTESLNISSFARDRHLHLDVENSQDAAVDSLDDVAGTPPPTDGPEEEVAATLIPDTGTNSVSEADVTNNNTKPFKKTAQRLNIQSDSTITNTDLKDPPSVSSFREIVTSEKHTPMSYGDPLLSPSDMFVKKPEVTAETTNGSQQQENQTHQIVSVKVSSSLAQATVVTVRSQEITKQGRIIDGKDIFGTFLDAFAGKTESEDTIPKPPESASLVTEVQPAATAFQRSQLSVEEGQPSSSEVVNGEPRPPGSYQHEITFTSPPQSTNFPLTSPVSYETSISTDTSSSRVKFYREPPGYRGPSSVAETVQQAVVAQQDQAATQPENSRTRPTENTDGKPESNNHQNPDATSREVSKIDGVRMQKSFHRGRGYHREPAERNFEQSEGRYGQMEAVFGSPEQNYEVDESVSVMSNGRIHGLQTPPTVTPDTQDRDSASQVDSALSVIDTQQAQDPNHKFGYVVEGRNFRKYRVEERTPDGFIVGEYGVVSHDDGSLRGVRYTADGTINPRLIYDALVKFLSL
ncbi:hypothetical protein PR048_006009 [Dryococelus australis]|uniref:Uncharacterized protein n=1 Tax=Dryococelus australis TaxID=614101 RepID=A0ABQ9I9T1_9NEOP|nr:hypothetical protein PR048_006009 [Dryococelus australis]